jgi:hypothetical protein
MMGHGAGRTAEAIPLHERTLADSERVLGAEHPAIVTLAKSAFASSYMSYVETPGNPNSVQWLHLNASYTGFPTPPPAAEAQASHAADGLGQQRPHDLLVLGHDRGPQGAGGDIPLLDEGGGQQSARPGPEEQFAPQPEGRAGVEQEAVRGVAPYFPAEHAIGRPG